MFLRGIAHVILAALAVVGCLIPLSDTAECQEEFFKPPVEVPPTKTPVGGVQVYSFLRYESDFRAICVELEKEGRRERVVKLAEAGEAREKDCVTCRSFWRMIVLGCGRLGPKPTPRATRTPRASGKGNTASESAQSSSSEGETPEGGGEGAQPTVSATPTQRPPEARYPSVAVVDLASRLSTRAYEAGPSDGPTNHMFRSFISTLLAVPDLNSAEREYYDIFGSYLLAAWEGRVDKTKVPTPTPEPHVFDEIFDF